LGSPEEMITWYLPGFRPCWRATAYLPCPMGPPDVVSCPSWGRNWIVPWSRGWPLQRTSPETALPPPAPAGAANHGKRQTQPEGRARGRQRFHRPPSRPAAVSGCEFSADAGLPEAGSPGTDPVWASSTRRVSYYGTRPPPQVGLREPA